MKEKVEKYMKENELELAKSVVIFATADDSIWFAEKFQMPVQSEFEWSDSAKLDQLKQMYNEFPKTGIILTQKEAVKVLDTELGTVKDSHIFELDIETENWKKTFRTTPCSCIHGKWWQKYKTRAIQGKV